jgi:hypothetical protein
MERKQELAEKILKLKLNKGNGTQSEIQKLQQEYDSLVIENQPKKKSK